MDFKVHYAALHTAFNLSHSKLRAIYETYGERVSSVWQQSEVSRLLTLIKPKSLEDAMGQWRTWNMETFLKSVKNTGTTFLFEFEQNFPVACREVSPRPFLLYIRGDARLLGQASIALVGSRRMPHYGALLVEATVPTLVRAGFVTVSGGAFGVDTHVHKSTMEAGGKTIAVLGTGVDIAYPSSNVALYKKMVQGGHLLVSEFPLGKVAEPYHFPMRNRIIAAIADSVLVVEARGASGSLITARAALDIGKETFCYIGNIFDKAMEGAHTLVQRGEASAVVSPLHLLEHLGCLSVADEEEKKTTVSAREMSFLELFSGVPADLDSIFENSHMTMTDFQLQMTLMEVRGYIKKVEGTKWIRNCSISFTTDKLKN